MADDQPPKKKKRPFWRKRVRRSTAAGEHQPVLLAEVPTDLDPANVEPGRAKLEAVGGLFAVHHANFAGLPHVLAAEGAAAADAVLADLGMSSMQVDDRGRGFS